MQASLEQPDKETGRGKKLVESAETEANIKDDPKQHIGPLEDMAQTNTGDLESGDNVSHEINARLDASGEVNMEASISSDDIIRVGGFGARDDISSFLSVTK
ncbi:hypothetical protein RHSIM_Rhsim04G0170300 [Rhododendron simsii]|uniref:Uncharacterized protein n=1 Tax=Rhododendron simsii TaxID=118357 RepID=A0A834LSK4_RHOSS|nr:hypothetical protein RHSIM_Rhsim04G0170300 [Rhododendron simsii]